MEIFGLHFLDVLTTNFESIKQFLRFSRIFNIVGGFAGTSLESDDWLVHAGEDVLESKLQVRALLGSVGVHKSLDGIIC
jgi:hypothetical protein